jgi:exonuclease 3'-5' domain-containing protein 1
LDLEGKNLCRHGTLTLMTVLVHPAGSTAVIDVQTLGGSAFTTRGGAEGRTLKDILQDPNVPKLLWDVRNDADALWSHHRVRLAGVLDVQVLENASRGGSRTYLRGLKACVQWDLELDEMELYEFLQTKQELKALMSSDIFARRPLDAQTLQYCANDVVHLPALRDLYVDRLDPEWLQKAKDKSEYRVLVACHYAYKPYCGCKKFGPWSRTANWWSWGCCIDWSIVLEEESRNLAVYEDIRYLFGNDDEGDCSDGLSGW